MEEAPPIVNRVVLLARSITPIRYSALERTLFDSLRSGRHSTGDDKLRQKYGWKYAALQTCPEGSIFPAVFRRIITCSIPQVDTGRENTFPGNTSLRPLERSLHCIFIVRKLCWDVVDLHHFTTTLDNF